MTIDEQIKKADAKIAEIEAALIIAQEHRRELVNRGSLNKCAHSWNYNQEARRRWCRKCGATQAIDDATFEGGQE